MILYASACQSHLLVSRISIVVNLVNEGPVVSGHLLSSLYPKALPDL